MTHQKGFAHAFLIIGLVVALIGALGFIFWQNFIHKEPINKNTELVVVKEQDTSKSDNNADKTVGNQYLNVTQLGNSKMKVPIGSNNNNYSAKYNNQEGVQVFSAKFTSCTDGLIGHIFYTTNNAELENGVKVTVGNHVYGFTPYSNTSCQADLSNDQQDVISEFESMFKNAVAI